MKAALITGIRQLEIGELRDPRLTNPEDVLVGVDAVGVCGSDIHYYTAGRIGSQRVSFPETVGHECAGVVLEAGAALTHLKAGQRVAIDPLMPCGRCDQCQSGRANTCRNQRFLGCPGEAPGAICERLLMPARCCYPIPHAMTMAQAAMVEPFSIALYAARMARLKAGASVAVLGSGPIGLCVLLACGVEAPCTTYATDLLSGRLAAAVQCGAVWAGNPRESSIVTEIAGREPLGMDCVFECAGQQETLDQAVEILKPGGTLLIVGIPEVDLVSFPIHQLRRKEITIRNVRRQNECTAASIDLIASGRANLDPLITHHFSLTQTKAAFDLVSGYEDGVIKAMIHVSGD
ncbi:MAG: alcohol dehydrogenase catalytic domain-containing protein [Terriglobia bacterium]